MCMHKHAHTDTQTHDMSAWAYEINTAEILSQDKIEALDPDQVICLAICATA